MSMIRTRKSLIQSRISTDRRAMTLMEVLVVMAIVGLLLGLLLPAVQQARASARLMECRSHMHQIGIAMHGFHDIHGHFPGTLFMTQLLPLLEQSETVDHAGIGYAVRDLDSVTQIPELRNVSLPLYGCPNDPLQSIARGRVTNYYINVGTTHDHGGDGFVRFPGLLSARDITDGLSNTVVFSERLLYPGDDQLMSTPVIQHPTEEIRKRRFATVDANFNDIDEFLESCTRDAVWFDGAAGVVCHALAGGCSAQHYNHVMTPNQNSCYNGLPGDSRYLSMAAMTANSYHSGGVNSLLGDGSVRFISNSIDRSTWRAAGTRSGND